MILTYAIWNNYINISEIRVPCSIYKINKFLLALFHIGRVPYEIVGGGGDSLPGLISPRQLIQIAKNGMKTKSLLRETTNYRNVLNLFLNDYFGV